VDENHSKAGIDSCPIRIQPFDGELERYREYSFTVDFGSEIYSQKAQVRGFVKIGIPKEIKNNETRVALSPRGVESLTENGHTVFVERKAGEASVFSDEDYRDAGGKITTTSDVWNQSDLILKVKEPLPEEFSYLRDDLVLFTFLHLAPNRELTDALLDSSITAIGYETVREGDGRLPLLEPMSLIAGQLAPQIAAHYLEAPQGGRGVLLGGTSTVSPGRVTVIGAGNVGSSAIERAVGLGAEVTAIDTSEESLQRTKEQFGDDVETKRSRAEVVLRAARDSDVVICAVLVPGSTAPVVVDEETVSEMQAGAVIVDVSIDQGGGVETIEHPTTHDEPIFKNYDVLHYAVANIPALVPRTSTFTLENATIRYVEELVSRSPISALAENETLRHGLQTIDGKLTESSVANAQSREYVPAEEALKTVGDENRMN